MSKNAVQPEKENMPPTDEEAADNIFLQCERMCCGEDDDEEDLEALENQAKLQELEEADPVEEKLFNAIRAADIDAVKACYDKARDQKGGRYNKGKFDDEKFSNIVNNRSYYSPEVREVYEEIGNAKSRKKLFDNKMDMKPLHIICGLAAIHPGQHGEDHGDEKKPEQKTDDQIKAEKREKAKDDGVMKITEYLEANTASMNSRDALGSAPIHYAAGSGRPELVKLLIGKKMKCEYTQANKCGMNPLMCAAASGRIECMKVLLDQYRADGHSTKEVLEGKEFQNSLTQMSPMDYIAHFGPKWEGQIKDAGYMDS